MPSHFAKLVYHSIHSPHTPQPPPFRFVTYPAVPNYKKSLQGQRRSLPATNMSISRKRKSPPSDDPQHSSVHSYNTAGSKFIPEEIYGKDFKLDSTFFDKGEFTHVPCPEFPFPAPCPQCGNLRVHAEQIFIAVSALCTPPGTKHWKIAIGVYFARNSHFNLGECVDDSNKCLARTQLHACLRALQETMDLKTNSFQDLEGVVIKTDSKYVVRHMTECIKKWRKNGFHNAKGAPVANADLFNQIDILIGQLNVQGIEVLFWQVERLENAEADALAGAAIRRTQQSQIPSQFLYSLGPHKVYSANDSHASVVTHKLPVRPLTAYPPGSFSSTSSYHP